MEDLVLVISFLTYSDWSYDEEEDEVDVHTEDTDQNVVGCARTIEEAASLISKALTVRAPSRDNEEDPDPLDYVRVDAVRLGAQLGEEPVWHAAVQPGPAEDYERCLDELREAVARHASGG